MSSTLKCIEKLSKATVDKEFQIEGALTLNAFADNAILSVIIGTTSNSLPDVNLEQKSD